MRHRKIQARYGWSVVTAAFASMLLLSMSADTVRTLEFLPETFDFGTIREDDGKASGMALAVNISPDTTVITSVRTSCGCTGASYTDRVLAPGDTAEICFTYNPANRPGKFEKTVKVFTGAERTLNTLRIKGKVIPTQESLKKSYPHESGGLWLSSGIIDAGKVHKDELLPLFIGIYNPQKRPVVLKGVGSSEALDVSITPDTLASDELGSLTMVLKPKKLPANTKELLQRAYIIDSQSSDTLANIPIGGYIVP